MNTSAHSDKEAIQGDIRAWKPILVFTLFTLAIGVAGNAVFQRYKEDIRTDRLHALGSIADMKVRELSRWIKERKGDAQSLAQGPFFLHEAELWLRRGAPTDETRARLRERLELMKRAYGGQGYREIVLFDSSAVPRLAIPDEVPALHEKDRENLLESMRNGQTVISDIHIKARDAGEGAEIDLMAPLMVRRGEKAHAIGVIHFNIDPSLFLFPFIQDWPISGTSAENLIIRREGDEVVYLNKLRYFNGGPHFLRLPLSDQHLLAAKALSGEEGIAEGVDYRGVPSIGVLSRITGTSWYLISKIDREEVFAPINRLARWVVALSLLIFATGCGIFVYWWKRQRQHIRLLQEQREYEEKYHRLFESAQEGICMIDTDSRITMVNPAMAGMLGYRTEEIQGQTLSSFMGEEGRNTFEQHLVRHTGGAHDQYDCEFVRKDGARIHATIAVAPMIDHRGIYKGAVAGAMDITERKRAEEGLVTAYRELQQLSSRLDIVRDEERTRIARELHDEMGATLAALKMRVAWLASRVPSELVPLLEETGHISALVSDGVRTMRHIVTQLRPSQLEDVGLIAALEDSVEKFRLNTGVACTLDVSIGEAELNSEQSGALFRVIQEALSNVAKHAQANHVDIAISQEGGALLLVVEDDGIGFSQETIERSFGLIGIRERALAMGGNAAIIGTPGKGTRVTVTIPAMTDATGNAHSGNS